MLDRGSLRRRAWWVWFCKLRGIFMGFVLICEDSLDSQYGRRACGLLTISGYILVMMEQIRERAGRESIKNAA
jgi:hypothetical protein